MNHHDLTADLTADPTATALPGGNIMDRHPIDLVSLIGGLIVVAVAGAVLAGAPLLISADLRWVLPALLVLIGVVLVATAGRRRSTPAGTEQVPDVPALPDAQPASDASDGSVPEASEHDEATTAR